MDAAPVAAFVKDADGGYVYANPHLLATLGKHMGIDWRGKTDADMWPPDAAALMRSNDEAVIREGGPQVFLAGDAARGRATHGPARGVPHAGR